jgi:hypothetical protein
MNTTTHAELIAERAANATKRAEATKVAIESLRNQIARTQAEADKAERAEQAEFEKVIAARKVAIVADLHAALAPHCAAFVSEDARSHAGKILEMWRAHENRALSETGESLAFVHLVFAFAEAKYPADFSKLGDGAHAATSGSPIECAQRALAAPDAAACRAQLLALEASLSVLMSRLAPSPARYAVLRTAMSQSDLGVAGEAFDQAAKAASVREFAASYKYTSPVERDYNGSPVQLERRYGKAADEAVPLTNAETEEYRTAIRESDTAAWQRKRDDAAAARAQELQAIYGGTR